jgi:hypothetical protein
MISHPEGLASALLKEFPALEAEPVLSAFRTPLLFIGGSSPRFDEAALKKVRPEAWVARVAVSGHFMQIFALPQIVTMIEKVHCRRGGTVARSYLATSCSFARYTYYHVCN